MGTRCLTVFQEEGGKEICRLYRQFDGYPLGHGKELVEFLQHKFIVNGFSGRDEQNFNGMGCLAAQVVAHFKKKIGNFYLYPPGTKDVWEEYIYTISPGPTREGQEGQSILLKIQGGVAGGMETLYEGDVNDCNPETVEKGDDEGN